MNKINTKVRLKALMKEKHISGAELARRMGVSSAYVNIAAQGKTNLSINKCLQIAACLDTSLASLFEGYTAPDEFYCPHCGKQLKLVVKEDED